MIGLALLFVSFEVTFAITNIDVLVQPEESELPIGSPVTLTCIVDEDNAPIPQWQYPVGTDPNNFLIEGHQFTIKALSEKNIGMYSCKVVGLVGNNFVKGEGVSTVRLKPERPGQPQNLQVIMIDGATVTLQWDAGFWGYADTLYYKLEYMKEDSSWKTLMEDVPYNVLNYTVRNLQLEMSYQFRITQVSKGGHSNPSDPSSVVYLPRKGAITVHPTLETVEQYNATSVRVLWSMPEFSDIVTQWFIEYRLRQTENKSYRSVEVKYNLGRGPTSSFLVNLEEYKDYQIRMFCRNEHGRGPPSPIKEIRTMEAAPSAPPRNVEWEHGDEELHVTWQAPLPRDQNGAITGYQISVYYSDPAGAEDNSEDSYDAVENERVIKMDNSSLPCWIAVAARTSEGLGPFSSFQKVTLPEVIESHSVNSSALDEMMALLKQPWLIAIIALLLLVLIVMISIIACRQQKLKRRKMMHQHNSPFLKGSYHSSVTSSMNGSGHPGQPPYRVSRDDGPQYEKIPDSRNTTPHGSRSFDGRMFDQRSTPNSYIDNRMPPPNYCPSNLSMDSQRYSMSQNSSIDDLASTIPSVTYSLPHTREGYKVVNPTSNERGPQGGAPVQVPPKAKEHDPSLVKPKVYGNITVKEWREQQLRKKPRGDGNSDTSLLSSFGKDSGRGSTDNVSVSGSESEGSDIEKYLEEDYSPRNSGYIEDDLMDVARMGMSRSPPDNSTYLNPNNAAVRRAHPPTTEPTFRGDDATSIESDLYMRCEAAPNTVHAANIYNLNGGVSEIDD